jgi:hypothetical protein
MYVCLCSVDTEFRVRARENVARQYLYRGVHALCANDVSFILRENKETDEQGRRKRGRAPLLGSKTLQHVNIIAAHDGARNIFQVIFTRRHFNKIVYRCSS